MANENTTTQQTYKIDIYPHTGQTDIAPKDAEKTNTKKETILELCMALEIQAIPPFILSDL